MTDHYYMDYNQPRKSGQIAFLRRFKREDNPCSSRTSANARVLWDQGWLKQSKRTCKGMELGTGVFSGCPGTDVDCPVCGQ